MKCKNCNTENILKANYCKRCGQQFTEREKKQAYEVSVAGKLEKAGDLKEKADRLGDILSLKFITDNVFVRIALIVIPFVFSMIISGGQPVEKMKIRESSAYSVQYDEDAEEYYVDVNGSSASLLLYVPKETQSIEVYFTDGPDYTEETVVFATDQRITVDARDDGWYIISAVSPTGTQSIKMFVI